MKHRSLIAVLLMAGAMCALPACGQTSSGEQKPAPAGNIPAKAAFEVASVKQSVDPRFTSFSAPGDLLFTARGASLVGLLDKAFGVTDKQIAGMPNWAASTRYDVEAKPPGEGPFNEAQLQQALQQLLIDRFHLAVHYETREVRGYALTLTKAKPNLQPGAGGYIRIEGDSDGLSATNTTMQALCSTLQMMVGFPVEDRTGMKGSFGLTLKFAQEGDVNSSLPSIYTAVQEQLKMKLVSAKLPLRMLVVDHVDQAPTPN
ncbi:MAG TPA: TIGR03435 family protein [Acidobacteriaceae bacterium]|nr:TIGR03435 family protein [Acidobacteriaceae bacterium]